MAIPILVVLLKYNMIEAFSNAPTKIKLSITGCILILIILFVNFKKILKYLNDMTFSVFKCIVNGVIKISPLVCILLILVNMDKFIVDLRYVVSWILGCNTISLFIFEPLYRYYSNEHNIDVEYNKWNARGGSR